MTDTPWRDVYDDPEGIACELEEREKWLIARHYYSDASTVAAAAACIRELAERVAELETPPHDEGAECGETHRIYDPGPAPEGGDKRLRADVRALVRTYSASLPAGFRAAIGMCLAKHPLAVATPAPEGAFRAGWLAAMRECGEEPTPPEECAAYHVALSGQPTPEQEGLRTAVERPDQEGGGA